MFLRAAVSPSDPPKRKKRREKAAGGWGRKSLNGILSTTFHSLDKVESCPNIKYQSLPDEAASEEVLVWLRKTTPEPEKAHMKLKISQNSLWKQEVFALLFFRVSGQGGVGEVEAFTDNCIETGTSETGLVVKNIEK